CGPPCLRCEEPHKCCGATCCIPTDLEHHYRSQLRWSVWNMWYFWFVILFVLMSCFGGCSYYRRHQLLLARHQAVFGESSRTYPDWQFSPSFPVSLFSGFSTQNSQQRAAASNSASTTTTTTTVQPVYPDAQISTQIFPSPPAYSEVVSHPDVYPPNKDPELPPYPGQQTAFAGNGVQLPPYSPLAVTMTTDTNHHGNQNQITSSSNITADDSCEDTPSVATSRGGTKYDCKTQTVSGFNN
ncbi:hypothetical protein LSH36_82g04058, partial [Paralvinella palmiformis]